jgi:hypothetical protein
MPKQAWQYLLEEADVLVEQYKNVGVTEDGMDNWESKPCS